MKLYFVRHGESEANTRHIISNRVVPRYPLTETGRQQAIALGQTLRGHTFAALYSSPILRALQTAELVAGQWPAAPEIRLAPALGEPDLGELEERGDDEAWRLHNDLYQRWWIDQEDEAKMPGGECFSDLKTRFFPFIDSLQEQYGAEPDAEVLLVGHSGIFLCMLPLLLRNISSDFAQSHFPGHGGLIVAEVRTNGVYCLSWDGLSEFAPQA
jgi:probable phosphoglycerate mutase